MRAIHLAAHHIAGGVEPLCGSWGGMDTGWTTVVSEVTCASCAARLRQLASEERGGARSPRKLASLRLPGGESHL
jgi:hypothetical protein